MMNRLHQMIPVGFLLTSLLILPNHADSGSFDDKGSYKVVIDRAKVPVNTISDDSPSKVESRKTEPASVVMHNKKGKPFRCLIPDRQLPVDEKDKLADLNTTLIEAALKPVGSDKPSCVNLVTSGWWHYELCFGKHVTQYHLEKGEVVPPVIHLGHFSHPFDWSNVSRKSALGRKDRHHTQFYVNGSECDINGKQRRADVKIYCDSNNWGSDYIESVREPESCAYEVIIYSKRMCNISYFRKDTPVVGQVVCNPIGGSSSPKEKNIEQVTLSNDKALLGFDESSSSSDEIEISEEETVLENEKDIPVVTTPKRLGEQSVMEKSMDKLDTSDSTLPSPKFTKSLIDSVNALLKTEPEKEDPEDGDERVLLELREAREAIKARGRMTLEEEVAVETVFKSHGFIHNARKLPGKEQAAALLRVMDNLRKVLKTLENEDTDEEFTAIMYSVTTLLLRQARRASGDLVYGKTGNRGVHVDTGPETVAEKEEGVKEDLYTEATSPLDLMDDTVLLLQKADSLREMKPFSSTEEIIYDMFTEADEQTQTWGFTDDDSPRKPQLFNEAREGWAITRFYVEQRRRLEDKNIRKEFEDNVIWIVEWKIKSLESISKFHETLDNTFSNKFTGDVRADDPWWRLNDDSSYNAYPLGIFDIWVPNQNELYADEKEVILSLMKAQIETYLFTGPDEAARFSGHNRLPGFQHALALVERAVSEITDPQKEMAKSFRQMIFPHARRMVSLLKILVEWSNDNRRDKEYKVATKLLDQQFSAAVQWAASITAVVTTIRVAEKSHFGDERGDRFRNHPDELDFVSYLNYEKKLPKFPLLPSEKHLDKAHFDEPFSSRKMISKFLRGGPEKLLALEEEQIDVDDDEMGPYPDTLTDDETQVVKTMARSEFVSSIVRYSDNGEKPNEVDPVFRSQLYARSRLLAEKALALLKDDKKNIRDEFKERMLSKVEKIVQQYGELQRKAMLLDKLKKKNDKLRLANKLLMDPANDIEDWKRRFSDTFSKVIGRKRKGNEEPTQLLTSLAKSKAPTFDDIIANMDPQHRKLKEMEEAIKERLKDFIGTGDLSFRLVPANEANRHFVEAENILKSIDFSQLQRLFKNTQQQFVQQQESNYNLDTDSEDA